MGSLPTTPGNSQQIPPRAPRPLVGARGASFLLPSQKGTSAGLGPGMGLWKVARGPQQSPASPWGASSPIPLPISQPAARRSSPEAEDPHRAGIFFATSSPCDPGLRDRCPVSSPADRGWHKTKHLRPPLVRHCPLSLADMVAVLGETTGCLALPNLRDKMKHHPEGYRILQCVPAHPHPSLVPVPRPSVLPPLPPRRGLG